MPKDTLVIDLEARSKVDIKHGIYRYVSDPSFKILINAAKLNDQPTQVYVNNQEENLPPWVVQRLLDPLTLKVAHNANFERVVLSKVLQHDLPVEDWCCTAAEGSAKVTLPRSLDGAAKSLNLHYQKLANEGDDLIPLFCVPDKEGNFRDLSDYPDEAQRFATYNARDVDTTWELYKRLESEIDMGTEHLVYIADQHINDRGVLVDIDLVHAALEIAQKNQEEVLERAKRITGLENPRSVQQFRAWLLQKGYETKSLTKSDVVKLLATVQDPDVLEALRCRQQLAKSSLSKYSTILNCVSDDGRLRGLYLMNGAHTGRWTSHTVNLQNLAKPKYPLERLDYARKLVKKRDYDTLMQEFESIPEVLSQLLRTVFVAPENKHLLVADYHSIEACVLSWLAGEDWKLEVLRKGEDIYVHTASKLFGIPIEEVTKEQRSKAKVAELALGYGGGAGALLAMGALESGLKEEELPELVSQWRAACPRIKDFWWRVHREALNAIRYGTVRTVGPLVFSYDGGLLKIRLPSGRNLIYLQPAITASPSGFTEISYKAADKGELKTFSTYGPKLVENIVQGTARDLLADTLVRLDNGNDYQVVMHTHDEVIVEAPLSIMSESLCNLMAQGPLWAEGLPLSADGFAAQYYCKA